MKTQWGYECPWGRFSAEDRETAEMVVENMRSSGSEATLIWRGITDWQMEDGLDD
jgi:hypothetical protein